MELMLREICRKRRLIPLPFSIASGRMSRGDHAFLGRSAADADPRPGALLKRDNVPAPGPGLADLGIAPTRRRGDHSDLSRALSPRGSLSPARAD